MKFLVGFVLLVAAVAVASTRPVCKLKLKARLFTKTCQSLSLTPMDWTVPSTSVEYKLFTVATKKDLLAYYDSSDPVTPAIAIRRRNSEGLYDLVANFTEVTAKYISTNGKWIASTGLNAQTVNLFSISDDNEVSKASFVSTTGGFLLSDDTFVGFDPIAVDNEKYAIRTYQYEASNNTWINIPGTEVIVPVKVRTIGDYSTYRATDTHLVNVNTYNFDNLTVNIYARQADRSWSLIDIVPVNSTHGFGSATFNGEDTLVHAIGEASDDNGAIGIVSIYTKIDGAWQEQRFSVPSVGYKPTGYLGMGTVFLDSDTMLVTAVYEASEIQFTEFGKVLMLTRNEEGLWEPAADLIGPNWWGAGVGTNDYDLVIPSLGIGEEGLNLTFYTAPRCFAAPINVTCNDKQVSDCSRVDVAQISISELYVINNPQCGNVTASLDSFTTVSNQALQVKLSFVRNSLTTTVYCNATVTCSAPPVSALPTPAKTSSVTQLQKGLALFLLVIKILF